MSTVVISGARWPRAMWAGVALVIALGVSVRVAGLFTDLWLDEIWTLRWGLEASSLINVFTVHKFKHDNNHWLNSVFIYAIGPQTHPEIYRHFALTSGLATLPIAWLLGRRRGRAAGALSVMLIAASFQLAHYTSESRGYAPAVFFALLAWLLLERYLAARRWYDAAGFWLAAALGFTSHLTFIYAYGGFVALTIAALTAARWGWRRALTDFAALHIVPPAFLHVLWDECVRPMRLGGGPTIGVRAAVLEYIAQVTGAPDVLLIPVASIVAAVLAWAMWRLRAEGALCAGVVVAPVLLIAAREPRFLYGRYFLICTPFILLMIARAFPTVRSIAGRAVVVLLLFAWTAGQVRLTLQFAEHGRGHYRKAIAYMVSRSSGAIVSIGSGRDRPFRDALLVGFHGRRQAKPVRFGSGSVQHPPDWVVCSSDADFPAPGEVTISRRRYIRDRDYPFRGLSGTSWHVYRPAEAERR